MHSPNSSLFLSRGARFCLIACGLAGLTMVFVFQQSGLFIAPFISKADNPNIYFSVNRTLRVLLNDVSMLLLIAGWFNSKPVIKLAVAIQIVDLLVLLPLYLSLKLSIEGDKEISSPLLSQLHRLIVNPTLMILLIPAVYFQRLTNKE